MTKLQYKKIILGTTYKAHNNAKIYGKICLIDLDLIDIILELATYCQLNLDFETQKYLEKMARDIQNKNKGICTYKIKNNNDTKFIN